MKSGLTKLLLAILLGLGLYLFWIVPKPADKPIGRKAVVTMQDGATIAYYQSGPVDGPRVLLFASLGRSVSDFNLLVPVLNQQGFRTIAINFRGVGASKLAPDQGKMTLFDFANDVQAVLSEDGGSQTEPVFVIGHAFGNRAARAYATQNTDTVKGIILIAAGGSQKIDSRVSKAMANGFDWKMYPSKRIAEIKYAFFAESNTVPSSWKRGWYKSAAELQIGAVRSTPITQWRDGGGLAPILVLQATQDRIAPASATSYGLKTDFPDRVNVFFIESAGHALLPEQPDIIADKIVVFLNSYQ